MKHIDLDRQEPAIRDFVRSLQTSPEGSVLEIGGKAVAQVLPLVNKRADRARLKAAILKRRAASRRLNRDWQAVDAESWSSPRDAE